MIPQVLSLFDLVNALACHVISLLLKTYSAELVSQSNFGVEKIFEKKKEAHTRIRTPVSNRQKAHVPEGRYQTPPGIH